MSDKPDIPPIEQYMNSWRGKWLDTKAPIDIYMDAWYERQGLEPIKDQEKERTRERVRQENN